MERMSGKLHLGDGKVYYLVRCDVDEAEAFEAANPLFIQPEKPPTQRVAAEGFEAFGQQSKDNFQLPPELARAAKDPRLQRFIEMSFPDVANKYTDSVVLATAFLKEKIYPQGEETPQAFVSKAWSQLVDAFQLWDVTRP